MLKNEYLHLTAIRWVQCCDEIGDSSVFDGGSVGVEGGLYCLLFVRDGVLSCVPTFYSLPVCLRSVVVAELLMNVM